MHATFCSILLFKVETVHFRKGMINERGDVSMLHQVTKKVTSTGVEEAFTTHFHNFSVHC